MSANNVNRLKNKTPFAAWWRFGGNDQEQVMAISLLIEQRAHTHTHTFIQFNSIMNIHHPIFVKLGHEFLEEQKKTPKETHD